jgi:glycosyltransferase involved in cell wall biosynthesis
MQILFLEVFFGGSHRAFAEGLQRHSRHQIELVTLPDRFWKWRMRGAALYMAPRIPPLERFDLVLATNLMSLADLRTLLAPAHCPMVVYFHENQLTYPVAAGDLRDVHFGFTDITTALTAEQVWFNSFSHQDAFLAALPAFVSQMPDARPTWITEAIRRKADVLYPGCDFPAELEAPAAPPPAGEAPPLIIWNHRWEFDKNPEAFFEALYELAARGRAFEVAILGECFQDQPKCFLEARERLGDRIVHFGFAPAVDAYHRWLQRGHLVVSTARQENFGFSVVEAARCGCLPLLPRRLSYPEIIPDRFHALCLYASPSELVRKLDYCLTHPRAYAAERQALQAAMARYAWEARIGAFDERLEAAARGGALSAAQGPG